MFVGLRSMTYESLFTKAFPLPCWLRALHISEAPQLKQLLSTLSAVMLKELRITHWDESLIPYSQKEFIVDYGPKSGWTFGKMLWLTMTMPVISDMC